MAGGPDPSLPIHSPRESPDRDQQRQGHQQPKPQDPGDQSPNNDWVEQMEKHKHTDAFKNTMRHFEKLDDERGMEKGHHYKKWNEERAKAEREARMKVAQKLGLGVGDSAQGKEEGSSAGKPRGNRESDDNATGRSGDESRTIPGGRPQSKDSESGVNAAGRSGDGSRTIPGGRLQSLSPGGGTWKPGEGRWRASPSDDIGTGKSGDKVPRRAGVPPKVGLSLAGSGKPHSGPIPITAIGRSQEQARAKPPPPPPPPPLPIMLGGAVDEKSGDEWAPPPPPLENLPVGGDIFVPSPFNTDPVRAKKFQEYVARRKEMLEKRAKLRHPIKTVLGKGEDAGEIHTKTSSPMKDYKAQYNQNKAVFGGPDMRAQDRPRLGEKVLKKIPIVKRAYKRSMAEEALNDAALSFTRGLLMGVFKTNRALDYKRKAALGDWLDLLRASLPPEIGLHELIDELKYSLDEVSERRENLLEVIERHPLPDTMWSDSCRKGAKAGGYFCGFWKLLHVMSVGFAEQAGGLALRESSPSIRVFSSAEAADVLREYMAYFFNCEKCSRRFIAHYDDCSFQRCHRLVAETVRATPQSWREFPLWLWQVHNDISRSKVDRAMEHRPGGRAEKKKWESDMKVLYPRMDQCTECITSSGTWHLDSVYKYLENEYWTFGNDVDPRMEKLLSNIEEGDGVSFRPGTFALATVLLMMAFFAKKIRIRVTGRHKKYEASSSFDGLQKKYRDA